MSTPSLTATSRAAEDPAPYTSLALSTPLPSPKLPKNEIYHYLLKRVCVVSASPEKSYTAAFIDNAGLVATTFDVFTKVMKPDSKGWQISTQGIHIYYNQQRYPTKIPQGFSASSADRYKMAQLELQPMPSTPNYFEFLPETFKLEPGMKVYFAGFGDCTDLTFHGARITSVRRILNVEHFEFDVPLRPSYYGGPVVAYVNGNLYLTGILTRGKDTDPELAALKRSVSAIKTVGPNPAGINFNPTLDIVDQTLSVIERLVPTGGIAVHAKYLARLVKKFEVSTHP